MGAICGKPERPAGKYKPQVQSILTQSAAFVEESQKSLAQSYAGDNFAMQSIYKNTSTHMAGRACNLATLANSLKMVFEKLDGINDKDLVLAISRTQVPKAGRSTLLSYCAFGPDKHELRKVTVDDEEKEVVDQTKQQRESQQFRIGHEYFDTKTQSPQFEYVPSQDLVYGDIVGLLDATGDSNRYINSLLWTQIFKRAKSVRFAVVLSEVDLQAEEYNQDQTPEVFATLEKIARLSNKDLDKLANSILPVISRVDPKSFDLAAVKSKFVEQIDEYIDDKQLDEEADEAAEEFNMEVAPERRGAVRLAGVFSGMSPQEVKSYTADADVVDTLKKKKEAMKKLAENLTVFDPLDRPINLNTADQGTKY